MWRSVLIGIAITGAYILAIRLNNVAPLMTVFLGLMALAGAVKNDETVK